MKFVLFFFVGVFVAFAFASDQPGDIFSQAFDSATTGCKFDAINLNVYDECVKNKPYNGSDGGSKILHKLWRFCRKNLQRNKCGWRNHHSLTANMIIVILFKKYDTIK
ncbi:hypothetical protein Avbf_04271 [Armadillidium vulgare]|nr:hypothetical protein Avbf_04271 [Armadillidium vulgare]